MKLRVLKSERVGDMLFVPYSLGLRERFNVLRSIIYVFFQRKTMVRHENGTWTSERFGSDSKLAVLMSQVETFLLGYHYRMLDLKTVQSYQDLKFMAEIDSIEDPVTKAIVIERIEAGTWNETIPKA